MNVETHIESLKERHAELERAIDEEAHRPLPDSIALQSLKRRKLRIKDEITRIARH